MAAIARTCRFAAVLSSRHARRGFRTSMANQAAQNMTMPAMSPTMTEGNITSWKVKEGDSFSAGDVLLEIETDKAQMDVEAQDDGIMAKITVEDGAKSVQVGKRIAVLAEPDDDLSTLEIPAEDKASAPEPAPAKKEAAPAENKSEPAPSSSDAAPPQQKQKAEADSPKPSKSSKSDKFQNKKYPLYPSVHALLLQNGLTKEDANKIPASGPQGRLLKGDVLAYMGKIDKNYTSELSDRIEKRGHLDLSNIQVSTPKKSAPEAPKAAASAAETPAPVPDTEVAVPISLSAAIATQKRVQDSLGIFLPLSTFIARASELANEHLPLSARRSPTADELFNSVLGLDAVNPTTSRGSYTPLISGLPATSAPRKAQQNKPDIIDFLAAPAKPAAAKKQTSPRAGSVAGMAEHSVFSVMAPSGEERRAMEYLERMKRVLEAEPGRLVL